MNFIQKLKARFLNWFRIHYENRISTPWGIRQFLANVAFIQLNSREYLDLNPSSEYMGMIRLTTSDMRPMLSYKFWPKGEVWSDKMPIVQCIVEERGFQVRTTIEDKTTEWEVVTISDPKIAVLKDLFLASAFYPGLRAEWKRPLEEQNDAA